MGEEMKEYKLDKEMLFRAYINKYEYKDINQALDDFNEIFQILEAISYGLQINRYNGHPRSSSGAFEQEVTSLFSILCDKGVIKSYPFKAYDGGYAQKYRGD